MLGLKKKKSEKSWGNVIGQEDMSSMDSKLWEI